MIPNVQIMPKVLLADRDYDYDDDEELNSPEDPYTADCGYDPEEGWTDEDEAGLEEYEERKRQRIALQWEDDKYWTE